MDTEASKKPETSPIETLLQDKELLSRLSSIAAELKNKAAEAPLAVSAEVTDTPPEGSSPPSADPLASALSSPALMAKLPEVVAALSAAKGGEGAKKASPDKRTALLLALRPYLSESRREAIDYITRIGKLGDMLKNLKLQ